MMKSIIKKMLVGMYAMAYIFLFSACSTSSVKDTEFSNEGLFGGLPSCFSQVYDSMYVATDKIATFTKVFPPQKMSDVLEEMKSKKICVSKYDGEKTEEAQILKMSSMNQLITIEMKIPFKEFPENCNLAYYDKAGNIVGMENMVIVSDDSEENVSLLWDVYPLVDKENALLAVKASWLALDKAVRIEVIHPDSLYSYQEKAQEYVDNIYDKLVEESNANDGDEANDSPNKNSVVQNAEQKEEKEDLALGGKGDLAAFDLHGNVKSCKWKDENGTTHNLVFDEQGKWIKYNGKPLSSLEGYGRDKNGRIASYVWGEMGCADNHILTYDVETGRLNKMQVESGDGNDVYTYKYDKKGLLTHRLSKVNLLKWGLRKQNSMRPIWTMSIRPLTTMAIGQNVLVMVLLVVTLL